MTPFAVAASSSTTRWSLTAAAGSQLSPAGSEASAAIAGSSVLIAGLSPSLDRGFASPGSRSSDHRAVWCGLRR
jgi:hypothetical protein